MKDKKKEYGEHKNAQCSYMYMDTLILRHFLILVVVVAVVVAVVVVGVSSLT